MAKKRAAKKAPIATRRANSLTGGVKGPKAPRRSGKAAKKKAAANVEAAQFARSPVKGTKTQYNQGIKQLHEQTRNIAANYRKKGALTAGERKKAVSSLANRIRSLPGFEGNQRKATNTAKAMLSAKNQNATPAAFARTAKDITGTKTEGGASVGKSTPGRSTTKKGTKKKAASKKRAASTATKRKAPKKKASAKKKARR